MKYFIELDNTLCNTINGDYNNSKPIVERITKVNKLKEEGHYIAIWTERGGIDYRELTLQQLIEWNIHYDKLFFEKPDFDDKSFNIDTLWPIEQQTNSKKLSPTIVEKGWGKEIVFVNNDEYCGKILCFNQNKKFSLHYHVKKKETWYVSKGSFKLIWIDTTNGIQYLETLNVGDVITNERGEPHQLIALEYSEIFEVSTPHYDADSFRIYKGD
jgi:mannose-6-phosphate isomerase-like protein (cupin superfamily)